MQFSNKFYDTIKWICLVAIPALSAFLGVVLPLIGILPDITTKIIAIIFDIGLFMDAFIRISMAL